MDELDVELRMTTAGAAELADDLASAARLLRPLQGEPVSPAFAAKVRRLERLGEQIKDALRVRADQRLAEAHQRIMDASPRDRHAMAARASRSYSVPESCVRDSGCRLEDGFVIWPDGDRWPAGA